MGPPPSGVLDALLQLVSAAGSRRPQAAAPVRLGRFLRDDAKIVAAGSSSWRRLRAPGTSSSALEIGSLTTLSARETTPAMSVTMKQLVLSLTALMALAGCDSTRLEEANRVPTIQGLPSELADVLKDAEEWTIYALQPEMGGPVEDGFHGFAVRGQAMIDSRSDRAQLSHALAQGIAGNQDMMARCFLPRHGIRAAFADRVCDLVICFECLQIYVYDGGEERVALVLTTNGPQRVFDRIYKGEGLSIAR